MFWNTSWKELLGRSKHRWVYQINLDLRDIGCEDVNSVELAQNSLVVIYVVTVMYL